MIALLALGFCWAHKTGEWLNEQTPIKIKTHGRYAYSLFRYGLDYLADQLYHQVEEAKHVLKVVILLLFPLNILNESGSDEVLGC